MQRAAQAYLQTGLNTNSPGQTVVMLYDGAIKFLNNAKDYIDAKDYANKGIQISKAIDIVNELSSALNKEQGGEIAENLHNLYFWCNARMTLANLKMDKNILDSVIKVLSGLRGAFAQIQETPEAQAAAEQLSARQNSDIGPQSRVLTTAGLAGAAPAAGAAARGRNLYSKLSRQSS